MKNLDNLELYTDQGYFVFVDEETGETYATLQTASKLFGITEDTIKAFIERSYRREDIYQAKVILAKAYYMPVLTAEQFLSCFCRYGLVGSLPALLGFKGVDQFLKYLVDYLAHPEAEKYRQLTKKFDAVKPHDF